MDVLSARNTFLFTLFLFRIVCTVCDDGVMYSKHSDSASWDEKFCIAYNPYFHDLPHHEGDAPSYRITDLSASYGCKKSDFNQTEVSMSVVIIARGNCTFSEKATLAQNAGAKAVVIASNELLTPAASNETVDYKNINITVAIALWEDINRIKSEGPSQVAVLFSPVLETRFDPNLAVIFLIAVSNIIIGGFWAGKTKHAKYQRLRYKDKKEQPTAPGRGETESTSARKRRKQWMCQ